MKEITKYDNSLNLISTQGWTADEMDFFFLIITRIQNQGCKELTFGRNELLTASGYKGKDYKRLRRRLDHLVVNVGGLNYLYRTERKTALWHMFTTFEIEWSEDLRDFECRIQVSKEFEYIANLLKANFTSFEFHEFASLRSTYAKTLFRLLKQFRQTGERYFPATDFRFLMGIPERYKPGNVQQRIFKPCLEELAGIFPDLAVETIKEAKQGHPVKGYRFTWQPQRADKWIQPEEYAKQKKAENWKKGRKTAQQTLDEYYPHRPDQDVKATPDQLEEAKRLLEQVKQQTNLKNL